VSDEEEGEGRQVKVRLKRWVWRACLNDERRLTDVEEEGVPVCVCVCLCVCVYVCVCVCVSLVCNQSGVNQKPKITQVNPRQAVSLSLALRCS